LFHTDDFFLQPHQRTRERLESVGGNIDYERFYDWCVMMAKNNIVFISEYNMPQDKFECIWSKKVITPMGLNVENTERTEKLFKVKERL
jgi:hypothetical protein